MAGRMSLNGRKECHVRKHEAYGKEKVSDKVVLYRIGPEDAGRIQILRLIFCIMVIFIHSYTEKVCLADGEVTFDLPRWAGWMEYMISQVICRCAVPGFFFLSAILLYKKDFSWSENLKRKVRTLLLPYLILNTFWIMFYYFVKQINVLRIFFGNQSNVIAQWGVYDWLNGYLGMSGYPILYPLWFIRDLFFLNIIAKALKAMIDRFPKTWILMIAVFLIFNVQTHIFFLSSDAVIYFSLGYYVIKYDLHFKDLDKLNMALIGIVYAACIAGNCLTYRGRMHSLFSALANAAGMVFFCRFSAYFIKCRLKEKLLEIAKYNFSIYLFHEMNLTMLIKIWFKVFPPTAFFQITAYFIIPFIIAACCLVLSKILERFTPVLYNILTGCRGYYS